MMTRLLLNSAIIAGLLVCNSIFTCDAWAKKGDKATVEPTELHMREGLRKMKIKDYEGAADDFLQSCYFARNQYNPQGWLYLGLCYKASRNYSKAIEAILNHLKQTTDKAVDAHVDLAECYMNIGEYEKAEKEIDKARYDSDGTEKRPYYAMGELLEKLDKPGEALEAYNTALAERPWKYTDAWMGRARCKMKLNYPNDAIKDYREIIDSAVKNVPWTELYYNLGQCLYKRGDHQGAIDHWLYALKDDPDHFDSHLALGRIFDEEKHVSSAITQYEHAIRCAPKSFNTDQINKRLLALQSSLRTTERDKEVKPSPYMRQQEEGRQQELQKQQKPTSGDSGF